MSISLPKGGGAIRGIGEKFGANPVTGSGSMSVPIACSPGRSGFGPQLSIGYDSGAGNGTFGFGWSLALPSVARKTDKGLPQYADEVESDVFVLSGAEDLVPAFRQDAAGGWVLDARGDPVIREDDIDGYHVRRYLPRIEGLFARIERWTLIADAAQVHWRSISKDNVLSVYGIDAQSRIFDPRNPRHVFSWLLCETRDDKGNAILYRYKVEDGVGVDPGMASERNRGAPDDAGRTGNRYLKRIYYGNRMPLLDAAGRRPRFLDAASIESSINAKAWMFELVFDYGEHDADAPTPDDAGEWAYRPDPFSTCRPGFEVRTTRRCKRALMFHHFNDEPTAGPDCLVRSTTFGYRDEQPGGDPHAAIYSFLCKVTQSGHRDNGAGYDTRSLPPLQFEYSLPIVQDAVQDVDPGSLENLPVGLDGRDYLWVDLHGEGVPGILAREPEAWFYKRNTSPLAPDPGDGARSPRVAFAPVERVSSRPDGASGASAEFMDLAGDGRTDLVVVEGPGPGLYEHDDAEGWRPFQPFSSRLNRHLRDPGLRLVDLDGDGRADVFITEDEAFIWHASLGEAGFGPGRRVMQALDEERGPRVVFDDASESIYLADMTGDGLSDLVRIRNGEVCYWPNLGYARFGAKVVMDGSPVFDDADQFDQHRILLADIDGSGTADVIYLHRDGVRLYFNQSGNGWSAPTQLDEFPSLGDYRNVVPVDLLGNGTACLVWSSPLPGDTRLALRYLDLMGGLKPHLLTRAINNLGAETRITYAPSTKFYLQDRRDGRPWITKLPFPVHVVEKVEFLDLVTRHRFASSYAYRHGYFDGNEREFRGFGCVEQSDTEAFEDYVAGVASVAGDQATEPEFYQPPVTIRTWFHTGAFIEREDILSRYQAEYWGQAQHAPEPVLPAGLDARELREAVRALKGTMLRQEMYSFDGSAAAANPYTVTENSFEVRRIQPVANLRNGVFLCIGHESVSFDYERDPTDPRISQAFGLEFDEYGTPHKSCSVVHGRGIADAGLPAAVRKAQQRTYITCTEADYTPDIGHGDPSDDYRLRVAFESREFELTAVLPAAPLFLRDEIAAAIAGATPIDYEILASDRVPQLRPLSRRRMQFLDDALNPLPAGQWASLGLPWQSFTLAFTPGVMALHYGAEVDDADFADAGYVHLAGDANWWIPSGTAVYPSDPAKHFYLPTGARDPLGLETRVTFDAYDLLPVKVEVVQAAWNVVVATNDYRVLSAVAMTDANGNRSAVTPDELGMVVASALMGKVGSSDGDTLADPTARMAYEAFNWMNNGRPNFVHTFAREQHGAANPRWQESYAYSDGSGGVAMIKAQAHPGKAFKVDEHGVRIEVDADPRWVGNGRTILDNKGQPVKQYQPYFSTTSDYEDESALREIGVTSVLFYDALGRNVRTLYPNGTLTRVEFTPWEQVQFDANDTVKESRWYAERGSPDPATQPEPLDDPERRAAWLAAKHADTPGRVHLDSLGRAVYVVSDYGDGKTAAVRSDVDLTGRFSTMYDQAEREVASGFTAMAGSPIVGESAEKGRRWTFQDVLGAMVRTWDEHGRRFRVGYDALHRPLGTFVTENGQAEILLNYVVYGDRLPDAVQRNLLGTAHQVFDQAGMVRVPALDFKGNPVSVDRVLAKDPANAVDWSALPQQADYAAIQSAAASALEIDEVFSASSTYDALNRPTQAVLPDGTTIVPTYNESNFLASLQARIRGQGAPIQFLKDQDYDAKGQRQFAQYGNGLSTQYFHDPDTFRLTDLLTSRGGANPRATALQDLNYTYDPVGNITQVRDDAQQTNYFNNAVVAPTSRYEYDALYQLVRATGRELAGSSNDTQRTNSDLDFIPQLPHANNAAAVRNYTEEYAYDLLGNLKSLKHRYATQAGAGAGWTRLYRYKFDDAPGDRTNQLKSTSLPGDPDTGPYSDTYDHDVYGNMIRMPHLAAMDWNSMDQLRHVDLGTGGDAYCVYGADGQRIRKIIDRKDKSRLEWIYLGAVMLFRRRKDKAGDARLERWTVHIGDESGRIAQVDTKTIDADGDDPANPLGVALIRYQYANHLGSSTLETNESGLPISYEEFHPFGTTSYRSAKSGVDLSLKRYRFSGKELDDETGMHYFGMRYYAAWLGRWASADPAGCIDGLNLYAYARNNPVCRVDPNGLDSGFDVEPEKGQAPLTRDSTPQQRADFVRAQGKELIDPDLSNDSWVGSDEGGHWELGTDASLRDLPAEDAATVNGHGGDESAASANETHEGGSGLEGAGGALMRNGSKGATVPVPNSVTDDKLARLNEAAQQRTAGRNSHPTNPTSDRRTSQAQVDALDEFRLRNTEPGVAGHRIDMQYDLTGEVGSHWRDYIRENGATNTNDGFRGWNLLRRQPQGVPAGRFARVSEIARFRNSPAFRTGLRLGGAGLSAVGVAFSAYGLYQDYKNGDVGMGVGDGLGVLGGGLEIFAALTPASATAVGGATVFGMPAMPLGIALGGVSLAIVSGIGGVRAYRRGDGAGAIAGGIGVAAGSMLAVGGGIALASLLGVAMAPALLAAAPVLIAAGAVLALGAGIFHLWRFFHQ